MAPLVRGSILRKFAIVVCCIVAAWVCAPLALAQHGTGRTPAAGVHVSAPPIYHVPISTQPVYHAPVSPRPILRAPISYAPISAPRITSATPAGVLGVSGFRPPRRPIRPFPPVIRIYVFPFVFGGPFFGFNSCWWRTCDLFWPTLSYVPEYAPANYVSSPVAEPPVYVYGEERPDLPQLYLNDGTMVSVTDYWVVDGQLHFTMIEQDGAKPEEQVIPFDALDLQKTIDLNTRRGFRFMLRNEPIEQYLRDHPDVTPPATAPPS